MKNPLGKEFTLKSLLKFAFPSSAMMVFVALYSIVDGIFVARFVNSDALAAINIVFPAMTVVMGIGVMFASGGSAIIARKMGKKRTQEARENFSLIMCTAVILSCAIVTIGLFNIEPLIKFLGASDKLLPYCTDYLKIIMIFFPVLVVQVMFEFLFVTAGRPMIGLFVTLAAGITNAILDYVFIVLFDMGIKGAAWGTVIGYIIPVIAGIIFFLRKNKELYFVKPKFDFKVLLHSCVNGSSEMVTNLASSITTFLFNITMMRFLGETGVAAITTVLYAQFLFISLFLGFSNGVAPVISYNYGRRNKEMLRKVFHICMNFIAITSLAMFLASIILSSTIAQIFFTKDSSAYLITVNGFILFSITYIFAGINIFTSALFTALSNGKISAFISFARTFVFIVSGILIIPRLIGVDGVWLSVPAAEMLSLILSLFFIFTKNKKYGYM